MSVIQKKTILPEDVVPDSMFVKSGWTFLIHYLDDGNVYYEKWKKDPADRDAMFMPLSEFVEQYNAGEPLVKIYEA